MKVKAIYRKKDIDPFSQNISPSDLLRELFDEVESDMDIDQLEEYATKATPDGYKFMRIERVQ